MKIGIIGSSKIGSALAQRFRAAGREVALSHSRGPGSLTEFARETGARAVSVQDAVSRNDVATFSGDLHA